MRFVSGCLSKVQSRHLQQRPPSHLAVQDMQRKQGGQFLRISVDDSVLYNMHITACDLTMQCTFVVTDFALFIVLDVLLFGDLLLLCNLDLIIGMV